MSARISGVAAFPGIRLMDITVDHIKTELANALPHFEVRVSGRGEKVCWFDLYQDIPKLSGSLVDLSILKLSVEWRGGRYGLHIHKDTDGGFEGADEVFETFQELISRLQTICDEV